MTHPLENFINNFNEEKLENEEKNLALKVWDVRSFPSAIDQYKCWYASFLDADTYKHGNKNKLFIALHFDATDAKILRVFFRFMDYVDKSELKLKEWHKGYKNCEYVIFGENEETLSDAIKIYLKEIRVHFEKGDLRRFDDFKPLWSG